MNNFGENGRRFLSHRSEGERVNIFAELRMRTIYTGGRLIQKG